MSRLRCEHKFTCHTCLTCSKQNRFNFGTWNSMTTEVLTHLLLLSSTCTLSVRVHALCNHTATSHYLTSIFTKTCRCRRPRHTWNLESGPCDKESYQPHCHQKKQVPSLWSGLSYRLLLFRLGLTCGKRPRYHQSHQETTGSWACAPDPYPKLQDLPRAPKFPEKTGACMYPLVVTNNTKSVETAWVRDTPGNWHCTRRTQAIRLEMQSSRN